MLKKVIKHLTCRRRLGRGDSDHVSGLKRWNQTFKRGYVEQAFRRTCVRSRLLHEDANLPFRQRQDWQLATRGKVAQSKLPELKAEIPVYERVRQMMSADAEDA